MGGAGASCRVGPSLVHQTSHPCGAEEPVTTEPVGTASEATATCPRSAPVHERARSSDGVVPAWTSSPGTPVHWPLTRISGYAAPVPSFTPPRAGGGSSRPAAKRRWGYFALPVLHGDRLVGKVDATTDHAHAVLRVDAVHWDVEPSPAEREGVRRELRSLARLVGGELAMKDR